jgi:aryl-alcohol dehydrogenase-like predicted oxidoreductase
MPHRKLGRTGLDVSVLGYGAWGIGQSMWVGANDDDSLVALQRAIDQGVNFIDTALVYGDGHSERLVGEAVRSSPETVYVATKVPPKNSQWPARAGVLVDDVFPGEWVTACTERSLRHLGVETIDVQQFHVWSDDWVGLGDWLETIERLKADGKIRFFGVSINDRQPANAIRLIETGVVDTVQVIYNIFEQAPEDRLFTAVEQANVGVIVRVPFDEGGLTGKVTPETVFPRGDFRNGYFAGGRKQETWDRVGAIARDLEISIERLPEIALRFCFTHPAVSTVIAGMRALRNVEANAAAAGAGPLSERELELLRAHRWEHATELDV